MNKDNLSGNCAGVDKWTGVGTFSTPLQLPSQLHFFPTLLGEQDGECRTQRVHSLGWLPITMPGREKENLFAAPVFQGSIRIISQVCNSYLIIFILMFRLQTWKPQRKESTEWKGSFSYCSLVSDLQIWQHIVQWGLWSYGFACLEIFIFFECLMIGPK